MSFHGYPVTDEPPGGDYVRYIESLVGGPPENAEAAGIELAERLAARAPLTQPLDLTAAPAPASLTRAFDRTAGEAPTGSVSAKGTLPPTTTPRPAAPLREKLSPLLIFAGAALIGLGFLAPEVVSIAPGFILLFAGFIIGSSARRRAVRTRSGTT